MKPQSQLIADNGSISATMRVERRSQSTSARMFDRLGRGRDGLMLDVMYENRLSFSAVFAFGDNDFTKVIVLGATTSMLVVARGEGYIVDVLVPEHWRSLPVLDVREVTIAHSFVGAAGCSQSKVFVVWDIDRVGVHALDADGIHDLEIKSDRVEGVYERISAGGSRTPFSLQIDENQFPLVPR